MKDTQYRPEIDGLRTIAVIPVVLFHLGYSWIKGGYYGVDVFFVISGFLITGILNRSIENGTFSMKDFWLRRVRRILPVLLFVVLTTLFFALFFVYRPEALKAINDSIPAVFPYFNLYAWLNFGDYWGASAENSFFLHTWSLAVEEQFYLLFPFFLFYSYRFFNGVKYSILIISLLSFVLFLIGVHYKPAPTFYLLPTRVWELALGGFFSVVPILPRLKKTYTNFFPILGVILIFFSYFFDSGEFGLSAILPVAGTLMILKFSSTNDFIGKVISTRPFTFIGKISYSIYLWHWPLIVLFKNLQFQLAFLNHDIQNLLIFVITILLAVGSFFIIENKTRWYKYTPQLVLTVVLLHMIFIFSFKNAFKHYAYKEIYTKVVNYANYYDVTPIQTSLGRPADLLTNVEMVARPEKFKFAYKTTGVCSNETAPDILILGDSHACIWGKVISQIGDSLKLNASSFAVDGSDAIFDINNTDVVKTSTRVINNKDYKDYYKAVKKLIDGGNLKLVVLVSRWDDKLARKGDYELLLKMIDYINRKKIKTLILTQAPIFTNMGNINTSQYLSYLRYTSNYYEINHINKKVFNWNSSLMKLASQDIYVYDVYGNMVNNNKMLISNNKDCFYFDDDHLSYQGTLYHKNKLYNLVKGILGK